MQVSATTLRIIRVARCLMLPCTACSSATSCKDCMSLSGSADCFWLSAFSDPIIGQGGVCVGATDGLTLRYPFYTPNQGCTPASLCVSSAGVCASSRVRKQCSYATTTSCQKCVTSGCFWQSNFISTCVVIFARSRVRLCVCMCVQVFGCVCCVRLYVVFLRACMFAYCALLSVCDANSPHQLIRCVGGFDQWQMRVSWV